MWRTEPAHLRSFPQGRGLTVNCAGSRRPVTRRRDSILATSGAGSVFPGVLLQERSVLGRRGGVAPPAGQEWPSAAPLQPACRPVAPPGPLQSLRPPGYGPGGRPGSCGRKFRKGGDGADGQGGGSKIPTRPSWDRAGAFTCAKFQKQVSRRPCRKSGPTCGSAQTPCRPVYRRHLARIRSPLGPPGET